MKEGMKEGVKCSGSALLHDPVLFEDHLKKEAFAALLLRS